MLCERDLPDLSEFDLCVYGVVVPPEHYLCRVLHAVDWSEFREILAAYYCQDQGRPAESPVLMLKLSYLSYHHNLSDREVIFRAATDMAFRYFLQIPVRWPLPDPSSLCRFRGRLGVVGFRSVFDGVVAAARAQGVIKDRLRLKDATHVIGNVAVPTALALVAQTRDELLTACEPFDPEMVSGERVQVELLRENTKGCKSDERLVTRVAHLREMLTWIDALTPPEDAETNPAWNHLLAQRDLAHQILEEQEQPDAGKRTVSTVDLDVRRSKHGQWYVGYLVDMMMDADSQMITAIDVLPAGQGEAADAVDLLQHEEAVHGNDVQAMSMDGIGFNGPVLRELEDPDGLNVDTYVPVPKEPESALYTPQDFEEDPQRESVTCPAGETSHERFRDEQKHTTKYRFKASACRACPLLDKCMKQPPRGRYGRTVCKTDFQVEHDRARHRTTTPEYAAIRREHKAVERKLGEMMNRHGGRHARYWGKPKALVQQLLVATAVNLKRLVHYRCAPTTTEAYAT